jgi:hypothetical protein
MGLAADIVQANYAKYRREAEAAAAAPPQPPQPGKEPIKPRTVEHSPLCARNFDRNALCDCKKR